MMAERPPIMLTKAEAMEFAAARLITMAHNLALAGDLLATIGKDAKLSASVAEDLREARRSLPAPDIQIAALRSAAAAIRDLALEERLVAARAEGAASAVGR